MDGGLLFASDETLNNSNETQPAGLMDGESSNQSSWQRWETMEVASLGLQYSFTLLIWFFFVMACYCSIPVAPDQDHVPDLELDESQKIISAKQIRNRIMKRIKDFTMELQYFRESLGDEETRPLMCKGDGLGKESEVDTGSCVIQIDNDEAGMSPHFFVYSSSELYPNKRTKLQDHENKCDGDNNCEVPAPEKNTEPLLIPAPGTVLKCEVGKSKLFNNDQPCSYGSLMKISRRVQTPASISWRPLPECCAICLGGFQEHQKVCWSSNPSCPHVFHLDCLLDWFVIREQSKLHSHNDTNRGRRRSMRQRVSTEGDVKSSCPCCRQDFLVNTTKGQDGDVRPNIFWHNSLLSL